MRDARFSPTQSQAALWLPPSERAFVVRAQGAWEATGEMLWKRFSGVLLVEAEKQVYAAAPVRPVKVKRKAFVLKPAPVWGGSRSEEHTSELQSLMRISYAVFCLKKKNKQSLHITRT